MKIKKTIIGLILVLILSLSIFALPKNDAKYIYLKKYYKINKDGTWSLKYSSKVKLNTYLATRRLFGETFITYNKKYQTLKVLKSITTMADGKKIPTPKNGYNEILPYSAHGFADFTNIRQMVVSHTGLERGAIEELEYIIKTKKDFLNNFFISEPLTERVPIDDLTIVFEIPSNMEFNYKLLNSNISPIVKNIGATVKYIFKIKNVKKTEHSYPYYPTDYPYLFVSTGNNYKLISSLFDKRILPENLIKKLKVLKKKSSDTYEFFMKIQKFIAENIQTANLGINDTGLNLRDIKKIMDSHYATSLEKASLMYAILKYYKFNPEIIILTPVKNINSLTALDKIFIKVFNKGHRYYINPNKIQSEFYPYGTSNLFFYNINQNGYENFEIKGYKKNYIKIFGKLYFCPKKKHKLIVKTKGFFNDYGKEELSFINSILTNLKGIKGEKIERINLKTPDEFSAKIIAAGTVFSKKYTGYYFLNKFSIPEISNIRAIVFNNNLPYHFKTGFKIKYDFDIILPENISVAYIKDNINIQNKIGEYSRKITKEGNNKIHLTIVIKIYKPEIENKLLLKELFDAVKKDKNILVLTYKK